MNPFAIFAMQSQLASLAIETQIVMSLRILAMAGALPARPGENNRIVAEKARPSSKPSAPERRR